LYIYCGDAGTGKSRLAYEQFPDLYELPIGKDLWFDGYGGQETVLFDDFDGQYPLSQLLKLTDNYYIRQVPIKGGHVWFNPKRIIITSNYNPCDWYDYSNRYKQALGLRRRVTSLISFSGNTRKRFDGADVRFFWPIFNENGVEVGGSAVDPIIPDMFQNAVLAQRVIPQQGIICTLCNYYPCNHVDDEEFNVLDD